MSSTTGAMSGPEPGATPASVAGPGDATNDRRPAADLDELGQDRQRDLLGRLGAEVEPGRRAQGRQPLVGHARLVAQPRPDDRGPGRRRDEPDVGRVAGERRGQRLLVPDALGGDDDRRRDARIEPRDVGADDDPLGAREGVGVGDRIEDRDAPAGGRAEADERRGDRRRAGHPQDRCRQMRFHVDLQRAPRMTGHDQLDHAVAAAALARDVLREPEQPRLAVDERPERLADDHRLGARAADPALDRAVRDGRSPRRPAGPTSAAERRPRWPPRTTGRRPRARPPGRTRNGRA